MAEQVGHGGDRFRVGKWLLVVVVGLIGMLFAVVMLDTFWPLPHAKNCHGDACTTSLVSVDWSQLDWRIPPSKIACGVNAPGRHDVLIGPGDVCSSVGADGSELSPVTYYQLRTQGTQRRLLTLGAMVALLTGTVVTSLVIARSSGQERRSRRRSNI